MRDKVRHTLLTIIAAAAICGTAVATVYAGAYRSPVGSPSTGHGNAVGFHWQPGKRPDASGQDGGDDDL
jgi:hypothetical protein